jgi:hypothetical protein
MKNKILEKKRSFSIELNSRINLKNVTLANNTHENVLIEGTIGRLVHARFVEGEILEVIGDGGILRIDIVENEFEKPSAREVN